MALPEPLRGRVFLLISLLGMAYVGISLANAEQYTGDILTDIVKLALIVVLGVVGFIAGREYFRFTHTATIFLAAMVCLTLFHLTELTEEFALFQSVPLFGEVTLAKRAFETVLMIGSICLFLAGNYLSVSEVNRVRKQLESNLHEVQARERRYRTLFEGANDAIFIMKGEKFIHCNSKTLEVFGCTEDQIIGETPYRFSPPTQPDGQDSREKARRKLARVSAGKPQSFEWRHLRYDGTPFDAEVSLNLVELSDGPYIQAIVRDVGERKRAESERARLIHILEATSDFVSTATPDGRITYLNEAGRQMLGWLTDEVVQRRTIADVHPDWACRLIADEGMPGAIQHGTWTGETAVCGADGQEIPVSQVIMSHKSDDGHLQYLSTIIRDLREHRQAQEALRASEETFRSIIEASPMGMYLYQLEEDDRLVFVGANPAADRLLGVDNSKFIGKTLEEAFPPLARTEVPDRYRRAARHGESWHTEQIDYDYDGISGAFEVHAFQMAPGKMAVLFHDITERKQVDEALRESEARFRDLYENAPNAYFAVGADARICRCNRRAGELLECAVEDLIGRPVVDLYADTPHGKQKAANVLRQFKAGHTVRDEELQMLKADGSPVWISLTVNAVRDAQGRLVESRSMVVDITERKHAEEALRESTARLQSVFDSSPLAITVTDLDGNIVDCSQAALDTYGLASKADALGKSAFTFIAEKDRSKARAKLVQLREHGSIHDLVLSLLKQDGTEFPGELSATLMRDRDGRPLGLVGISADITERRRAERERLDYQRKLRSLASELSLAEERERRRIATGLHDHACQALVLSKMRLQAVQASAPAPRGDEIGGICSALDETIHSVRGLIFDLSSPTLYKFGLEAALAELLEDKLKAPYGIQCVFRDDGAPKPLAEDVRILLFQSVRELLINTVKHAHAHEVTLNIARSNDCVEITVTDDGVGFDVEDVLSAPSRSRGFGLFNIQERLDYIGGSLDIHSRPGEGSRFTLIARLQTAASPPTPATAKPANSAAPSPASTSPTNTTPPSPDQGPHRGENRGK
ncbi:MAG: PAS domain S-box protein [Phycisphaerales bacterium]|nr:MAG: PAS domain S-box protein [Phycisphaerales bacterium]